MDPADTAAASAISHGLPPQPFYEIASFGQTLEGGAFDDAATPAALARVQEAIAALVQGQGAMNGGRLGAARTAFERAHALNPSLIGLNTYLGLAIAMQGDYRAALPYCEREVVISPDLPLAYANLGFVEGNLGLYDAARVHLERAIALDPGNAGARAMLEQVNAAATRAAAARPPAP
jgi:tetratricopeptide (TPR) repeat protein